MAPTCKGAKRQANSRTPEPGCHSIYAKAADPLLLLHKNRDACNGCFRLWANFTRAMPRSQILSSKAISHGELRRGGKPGACTAVLRRLGRRVEQLSEEIDHIDRSLLEILAQVAPALLTECGVGPVCAAQLLISSGDQKHMTSKASFAALAGTNPLEASSGHTRRHRLNRGGDRQLNWALHVIALQRIRYHPEPTAYYHRLRDRGKTAREARRCIKRALARHFYRQVRNLPRPLTT